MASVSHAVQDTLRGAGHADPDLRELTGVLKVHAAAVGVRTGGGGVSAASFSSVTNVVALLRAFDPTERAQWCGVLRTLESFFPACRVESVGCSASELVGLAELADMVDICGQSAAPCERDRVGTSFKRAFDSLFP